MWHVAGLHKPAGRIFLYPFFLIRCGLTNLMFCCFNFGRRFHFFMNRKFLEIPSVTLQTAEFALCRDEDFESGSFRKRYLSRISCFSRLFSDTRRSLFSFAPTGKLCPSVGKLNFLTSGKAVAFRIYTTFITLTRFILQWAALSEFTQLDLKKT